MLLFTVPSGEWWTLTQNHIDDKLRKTFKSKFYSISYRFNRLPREVREMSYPKSDCIKWIEVKCWLTIIHAKLESRSFRGLELWLGKKKHQNWRKRMKHVNRFMGKPYPKKNQIQLNMIIAEPNSINKFNFPLSIITNSIFLILRTKRALSVSWKQKKTYVCSVFYIYL